MSRAPIARSHRIGGNVGRRAFRGHLLEALVLQIVEEADGVDALRDARGLVVGDALIHGRRVTSRRRHGDPALLLALSSSHVAE